LTGRTSGAAVRAFVDPLQAAISCVTPAILIARRSAGPAAALYLTLSEEPAPLGADLSLAIEHRYAIVEAGRGRDRWRVRTTGYSYRLSDVDRRELVVYQWNPDPASRSPVRIPHLHIGRSLDDPSLPPDFRQRVGRLVKAHLPTGHVTLTAILRVAIEDLGVTPSRADWGALLRAADGVISATL
jgi:hypothetical protein